MSALRSLRIIARTAPKTNLLARPVSALPRPARLAQPVSLIASRSFSSTPLRRGSGESDAALSAALAAEHKYELEEASALPEIPEFLEHFQAQGVWDVLDTPGSDDVVLKRKFGSETLKLTFQISDIDPPPEVAEADGAVAAPPSSPEDDLAEPTYITCSLLITKPAYANAVSVDLSAGEEGFDVTNVAIFAKTLGEMEGAEGDWQRRSRYLGPQFEHLDQTVQEALASYLAERGVDETLSNFILSYAEYKEQKDYVSWLGEMKAFVDQ